MGGALLVELSMRLIVFGTNMVVDGDFSAKPGNFCLAEHSATGFNKVSRGK